MWVSKYPTRSVWGMVWTSERFIETSASWAFSAPKHMSLEEPAMNQSSATRGHWLIAIGAIAVVGAVFLQWWQVGGGPGELPERSGLGISDGRVLLMFIAAAATLLLVTLPFASERPIGIDHPLTYIALLAVMIIGYLLGLVG